MAAAAEYDGAQRAWHASERRYATKTLRFSGDDATTVNGDELVAVPPVTRAP